MTAPLCAETSADRGEPLGATASRVDRWLLLEHTGAWGPPAPPVDRLEPAQVRAVSEAADRAGARLLMVRRPVRDSEPGRWVFAAISTVGSERLLGRHVAEDDPLLDLEEGFAPGVAPGWTELADRLWLVCTHGRHDLCCALRGQPVARALLAADPLQVWECSHVGGDRFAPNVVILPDGHYLGRVEADEAPSLVEGLRAGRLPVERWRGRSSLPLPTQAAQSFARTALQRDRLDDLALVAQHDDGRDRWRVVLADRRGEVEVVVRYERTGEAVLLTCDAGDLRVPARFELVSLTPSPPD